MPRKIQLLAALFYSAYWVISKVSWTSYCLFCFVPTDRWVFMVRSIALCRGRSACCCQFLVKFSRWSWMAVAESLRAGFNRRGAFSPMYRLCLHRFGISWCIETYAACRRVCMKDKDLGWTIGNLVTWERLPTFPLHESDSRGTAFLYCAAIHPSIISKHGWSDWSNWFDWYN